MQIIESRPNQKYSSDSACRAILLVMNKPSLQRILAIHVLFLLFVMTSEISYLQIALSISSSNGVV